MGRIRRSRTKKALLGLALFWIVHSVIADPTTKVVPNFYDPKYHDDGRDETKIIEYLHVESSNVFTIQPSTGNQEFHDINPGSMGIYSGTGPTSESIPNLPEKVRNQNFGNDFAGQNDNSVHSGHHSFTKAQSYFKDDYNNRKPQEPIGVFQLHSLQPPTGQDYSQTGKVTWPSSQANADKQSISLTQSPPTVSSSYNSVPVFNADPIYDHPSVSKYPLDKYPPSVPVPQSQLQGLTLDNNFKSYKSYQSDPFAPSRFNLIKANEFKPTVLKELNEGQFTAEYHDKIPTDMYHNYNQRPQETYDYQQQPQPQGPLSAFYQNSQQQQKTPAKPSPPIYSAISNVLMSEYAKVANGLSAFYHQKIKQQDHPIMPPPLPIHSGPLVAETSDQISNEPYRTQDHIPLTSSYQNIPQTSSEHEGHGNPNNQVPTPATRQLYHITPLSLSRLNPWNYFGRRPNSDPEPSYKYQQPSLPLSSHYTKGFTGQERPSGYDYNSQESYTPGRPVLNSQSNNFKGHSSVPEFGGGIPVKITSHTVTRPPIVFGEWDPPMASSYPRRPLSSYYDSASGKLPDFKDGVTAINTSYPSSQLSGFEQEDFSQFEKPESFDDFNDINFENSYRIKKPSTGFTPGYSIGQYQDDDTTGWSPTPFSLSSLFSLSKRPNTYSNTVTPGYRPGGWSTYGSYKPPQSELDQNHPSSYFSKGRNQIKYGTPYDLIQSPDYGKYHKNKYGGWERSPSSGSSSSTPLKGYRYRYSTLHHPGSSPLDLPSQYDMENNPPEPVDQHNYDCENRHSCTGQQASLGISSSVDLTRSPKKRRFRNSLFKILIRRLAGKRRRRPGHSRKRRPCRGRRC